jgi:hypothetical protein
MVPSARVPVSATDKYESVTEVGNVLSRVSKKMMVTDSSADDVDTASKYHLHER